MDNPAEGTGKTVTVSTSADTDPVQSAPFAVTPARPVAGVGVGVHLPGPADAVYEIEGKTVRLGAGERYVARRSNARQGRAASTTAISAPPRPEP